MRSTYQRTLGTVAFVILFLLLAGCQNAGVRMTGAEPAARDCKQIVYSQGRLARSGSEANLVAMCPDGTEKHRLTSDGYDDLLPSWSPDGSTIAFLSDRSSANLQLHLMDADGGHIRQITDGFDEIAALVWFPEGNRIALLAKTGDEDLNWQVVELASKEISPMLEWTRDGSFQPVAFSHDGARLVYLSSNPEDQATPGNQIRIQNRDGSGDSPLTDNVGFHLNPVWSPDDSQIAYVSEAINPGKQFAIYIQDTDGRKPQQVIRSTFLEPPVFTWSPDGKSLAIYGNQSFWVWDLMSGEQQKLFSLEEQDRLSRITWQPKN